MSKTAMAATTKKQGIEAIISHGSTGYMASNITGTYDVNYFHNVYLGGLKSLLPLQRV